MNQFSRSELILPKGAMSTLSAASVAVFGIGGVGSFAAEALARSGVGSITLIDSDTVSETNINRQSIAFLSTVGQMKTEVMARRIADINPSANVFVKNIFLCAETQREFDFSSYDYVVDAIDTVSSKILLAERCVEAGTPLISCMGMGNKLNPCSIEVSDIFKTSVCPLARVMRHELKKRGIRRLKCVYSKEVPLTPDPERASFTETIPEGSKRRQLPGSAAFVPSVAGLIIAGEVVCDILGVGRG
ncbi:MAG: tRNA threonylcarbamoyladenosine dehydratase [Oscillospiraceae bacterium]|jgi:tRNA A37 threonylcarbamoyladenosine dehydratase|nr:tRNA threonylcarbamoyladenosine dehydratase [Oscillospiraceae bacterium]